MEKNKAECKGSKKTVEKYVEYKYLPKFQYFDKYKTSYLFLLFNIGVINIQLSYMTEANKIKPNIDQNFDEKTAPKRKSYKKIRLQIKKLIVQNYTESGISIAQLTKMYHLSYSTIAHIIKIYEEKNKIFESKDLRLKRERQEEERSQERKMVMRENSSNYDVKVKESEKQGDVYYPFAPYWPLLYFNS